MKKSLLLAAGLACIFSAAALADCICGTMGCESCDSAEDYLEDVGKHLKKQSKKVKKHIHMTPVDCKENMPIYWEEDVALIGQNATIILDYAEMLDDEVIMTPAQKKQAKTDALQLKASGQKIKDKAANAKKECETMVKSANANDTSAPMNMHTKSKHHDKHKGTPYPYADMVLIESMEDNGDMLIQVGDFMLENIAK